MQNRLAHWIVVLMVIGIGFQGVLAAETQPSSAPGKEAVATATGAAAASTAPQAPPAEAKPAPTLPAWVQNFKLSGDFRYRQELADDATKDYDRNRARIRARLYVGTKVNDEVDAMIGLASGTDESATNTNQELTDAFSSKPVWLDLAFFDYHPASVKGLNILGGKIKQPYYFPGDSDILFDTDVRPEGIAATYKKDLNSSLKFFGTAAGHYVQERSTEGESSLWVAQGGLTCAIPNVKDGAVTGGAGFFGFGDIQGEAALGTDDTKFRGNTSAGGVYVNDYEVFQTFGEVAIPIVGQPFSVYGELLINTGADTDEDTGFLVGAGLGKCKDPKSWQVSYNYRDLEADCTIAALVDSTFAGGGTAVRGHKISVGYQIAKNWNAAAAVMIGEKSTASTPTDYDVFLAELNFKF